MFNKLILKYILRKDDESSLSLGAIDQPGALIVVIKTIDLWNRESFLKKIKSVLSLTWIPTEELVNEARESIFYDQVFGQHQDFSEELYKLSKWHNSREWSIQNLTDSDRSRAEALDSMTILTTEVHQKTSDLLHLRLGDRFPFVCFLVYPMIVKIPVISIMYYVCIHNSFTFNSIRKANHPQADKIIDYLYEVLYLQQKTAIALHGLLKLIIDIERHKAEALITKSEIDAVIIADSLFSYLKACVEKNIVLVGLIYGILNLDNKHEHRKKIKSLSDNIPRKVLDLYYVKFMLEYFSSENLDELNDYRSGLLHKREISDLQPHKYFGKKAETLPLKRIFQILHEQHTKNASVLIGTLAMLTDTLVELDSPKENVEDIYKILTSE